MTEKKISAVGFLFFILVIHSAFSQTFPDNYGYKRLDNGLEILVIENPQFPLVEIELSVKCGSVYETPEESGLSLLNRFLFFSGNKDFNSRETMQVRMKQLGLVNGSNSSEEHSSFYFILNKSRYEDGLKLINSASRYPLFLPDEVQEAIQSVTGQYQQTKIDPFYLLDDQMKQELWKNNYYRKNQLGDYALIQTATNEQLAAFHTRFFVPNNCLLIVSGNVQRAEVFQKVQLLFGDWKRGGHPFDLSGFPEFANQKFSTQFIKESPLASSPAFLISFRAPDFSMNKAAALAAEVFAAMLMQSTSPYNESLISTGAVLQSDIFCANNKYGSTINFLLLSEPSKVKDAHTTFSFEKNKWQAPGYFTDKLLEAAKKRLRGNHALANEKLSQHTHNLAMAWANSGLEDYLNYPESISSVTVDDVVALVNQYIIHAQFICGLLISPSDRKNFNTDRVLAVSYPLNEYIFTYEKNAAELSGTINLAKLESFVEFLRINPRLHLEMTVYQDETEKKGTAMERFLAFYQQMKSNGAPEELLDAMKVSLYIQSEGTGELKTNQYISFNLISTNFND